MLWNFIFLALAVLGIVCAFAPQIVRGLGLTVPPGLVTALSYVGVVIGIAGIVLRLYGISPAILEFGRNHSWWFMVLSALVGGVHFIEWISTP